MVLVPSLLVVIVWGGRVLGSGVWGEFGGLEWIGECGLPSNSSSSAQSGRLGGGVSCDRLADFGCGQGWESHTWLALTFRRILSILLLKIRDTVALGEI